jgi:hypothetical protein
LSVCDVESHLVARIDVKKLEKRWWNRHHQGAPWRRIFDMTAMISFPVGDELSMCNKCGIFSWLTGPCVTAPKSVQL